MTEIWKQIEEYPQYMISNMGRVKSLGCYRKGKNNSIRYFSERILKPDIQPNGYLKIGIWNENGYKKYFVHRLVSMHFIPNPENKPCVDHINTDRTDNRVENLRWCTQSENLNNPITKQKMSVNNIKEY